MKEADALRITERSLPHRQFRNSFEASKFDSSSSLPHRQFRNLYPGSSSGPSRSLPHRQFRKLSGIGFHDEEGSLPYRQFRNHLLRCLPGLWGSLPYKHSFVICSIRTRGGEISADCHIFFKNSSVMCHVLSPLDGIIDEDIRI